MDFAIVASRLLDQSSLSQRQIAARCGVSQTTVSRWLSGRSIPDLESAAILADLLDVPLDLLAGRVLPDPDRDYLDQLITTHGVKEVIRRVLSCEHGGAVTGGESLTPPPAPAPRRRRHA